MRENLRSRWVVRLAIAGSVSAVIVGVGATPALAKPPTTGTLRAVPGAITLDSVHTASKGGTIVQIQDSSWS